MAASPQHATLVAATPMTLNFDAPFPFAEVVNVDGAAPVYFTTDGTTPTVGGAGCHVLPAAICSIVRPALSAGNSVVKLISAGTPKVAVTGLASSQ